MTWQYQQSTGRLTKDGKLIAIGYSGHGAGKNNPALEHVRATGPIPRGRWKIVGPPYNSPNVGPYTLKLFSVDSKIDDVHEATGRSAFRIHGDSISNPGTASNGCIILARTIRSMIWNSGDRDLVVVA